MVPVADQQIGGQADPLPADKEKQQITCQHQQQHGKDEEIEAGKEAGVILLMFHVADRVDMDEKADAGDDQGHPERKMVESEAEVGIDPLNRNPFKESDRCGIVDDQKRGEAEKGEENRRTANKAGPVAANAVGHEQ